MQKFPLSMHPKRQFARANFVLLDGIFTYEVLPHFVIKEQLMNEINTPSSIGSAYGTKDVLPNKYLHMKRSFYIDEAFLLNDLIELHILGLDQIAKVYINDVLAIETSLPFYEQVVNVKKFLKIGDNEIYFIIKDDNLSSMYAKGYQDYERSKNRIGRNRGTVHVDLWPQLPERRRHIQTEQIHICEILRHQRTDKIKSGICQRFQSRHSERHCV